MLHITNGECANARLRDADIPGEFLGWNDPLHHGPVPAGLSMPELSELRAGFIAENGWQTVEAAKQDFADRDLRLREAARTGEVVIWSSFELFDQLHLLQLLSWFEQRRDMLPPPSVVWVFDYLGGGSLDPDDLRNLYVERQEVSAPQSGTAADIWQAFTASDPTHLVKWQQRHMADLPHMHRALGRLLEEYPWVGNGLSRTHRQILQVLEPGPIGAGELFKTAQALEPIRFMGDYSFWVELKQLLAAQPAPVTEVTGRRPVFPPEVGPDAEAFVEQQICMTDFGRDLLAEKANFITAMTGTRWIGGVRIDRNCAWFWHPARAELVPESHR